METTEGTQVRREVLLVLALELLDKVVDETIVEVLTTQVSVTSSGLDFEDTHFDGQKGHIESSSSKIKDEHITLTLDLLVKTISNGSSSGFIDDTQDVQARNCAGILCGLMLQVIEVGRDGDDCVVTIDAKIRFSSLLHLEENHR